MNTVQQLNQLHGLDFQTRFLARLAHHGLAQHLAHFDQAAGDRPPPAQGFRPAPHQENAAIAHDHRSHTHQRRRRVLALQHVSTIVHGAAVP